MVEYTEDIVEYNENTIDVVEHLPKDVEKKICDWLVKNYLYGTKPKRFYFTLKYGYPSWAYHDGKKYCAYLMSNIYNGKSSHICRQSSVSYDDAKWKALFSLFVIITKIKTLHTLEEVCMYIDLHC